MKRTTERKTLAALLIGLMLATGIGTAVIPAAFMTDEALAETPIIVADEIAETYAVGETVALPEQVPITYGGESFIGEDGVLVYPDATVRAANGPLTLDMTGRYTVMYYFTAGDRRLNACKYFTVSDGYFTLSADNGSVMEIPSPENPLYTWGNTVSGLIVRLAEGCEIRYNKPVDLRNSDDDGLAAIACVDPRFGVRELYELGGRPAAWLLPEIDATICTVRLTDCYDPAIYVDIKLYYDYEANFQQGFGYYRAGSNSQQDVGLLIDDNLAERDDRKIVYIGENKSIRAVACFGHLGVNGIAAAQTEQSLSPNKGIQLWYDLEGNKVYFTSEVKNAPQFQTPTLINDLSNEDIYGDNTFAGFTTGEVYVSFRVENYVKSSARVDILSIGEDSGSKLTTYAQETAALQDETDPVIEIDVTENETGGLVAAVGDTVVLPDAEAYDVNLSGDVNVNVYRKYGTPLQTDVAVTNGAFKVEICERYYIVYTARDRSGRCGEAILVVNPIIGDGSSVAGKLTVNKAITLSVDKITAAKTGERINIPAYSATTVNRADCLTVQVSVAHAGQTVPVENGSFVPVEAGTYTVTYFMSDNAVSYTASYDFAVAAGGGVGFLELPVLPKYYVKNAVYDVPEVQGYSFGADVSPVETAEVAVSMDGKAYTDFTDPVNGLKIDADNSVRFRYTLSNGAEYITEAVPVADVGYGQGTLRMKDYFVGAFSTEEADPDGYEPDDVTFYSDKTSGSNRLDFINRLLYTDFRLHFRVPEECAQFTGLNVILTDPYNDENTVTIGFVNEAGQLYSTLDGRQKTKIPDAEFADDMERTIRYDSELGVFSVNVNTKLRGEISFASPYAYLSIELIGIKGAAAVEIIRINNQAISGTTHNDNATPTAYFPNEGGHKAPGSVVTIFAPDVGDVLSPVLKRDIVITVVNAGKYATSTDGVVLDGTQDPTRDYQLDVGTELGAYIVTLTASDALCVREYAEEYTITVVDVEPPTITLTDGYKSNSVVKVWLGSTLPVRYTVTDNYSSGEDLVVMTHLFNETTQSMLLNVGEEVTLYEEGRFVCYVYAYDKAGNFTSVSFKIEVVA